MVNDWNTFASLQAPDTIMINEELTNNDESANNDPATTNAVGPVATFAASVRTFLLSLRLAMTNNTDVNKSCVTLHSKPEVNSDELSKTLDFSPSEVANVAETMAEY